jgi:hypothetical protein
MHAVGGKKRGRNAIRLAEANPFAFDDHVEFEEQDHIYRVHGKKAEMSVTNLVKVAFPSAGVFDAHAVCVSNLARWRTNASNRYHSVVAGLDDESATEAVMALWERNKALGTLVHKICELALNDELEPHDPLAAGVAAELEQFMLWHERQMLAKWSIVRTELALYHTRADNTTIGGQIDCLYKDNKGKFRIIDIKRSDKNLTAGAHNFGKMGAGVAAAIKDTDHYKYSLQCHLYSSMLEKLTGKECGAPLLVQLHPDLEHAPNVVPCADLRAVARQLLDGA